MQQRNHPTANQVHAFPSQFGFYFLPIPVTHPHKILPSGKAVQTDEGLLPFCLRFLLYHLLLLCCNEELCLLALPREPETVSYKTRASQVAWPTSPSG